MRNAFHIPIQSIASKLPQARVTTNTQTCPRQQHYRITDRHAGEQERIRTSALRKSRI